MSLWAFVCSVLLCFSVRNRTLPLYDTTQKQHAGEFFLSRRVFFSLTERTEFTEHFCAQFRAHRTPSAYRVHRGLSAIIITNKGHNEAYILFIGVSRRGAAPPPPRYLSDTCLLLSLCHYVLKIKPFSFCHYVILSKKSHLSSFVIMSLCLKKHICLLLSLCHYVLKKIPVSPHAVCSPV